MAASTVSVSFTRSIQLHITPTSGAPPDPERPVSKSGRPIEGSNCLQVYAIEGDHAGSLRTAMAASVQRQLPGPCGGCGTGNSGSRIRCYLFDSENRGRVM